MFCRGADGAPIGYPMFIFARRATEIILSTYRKSAKVRHIERDARVAMLSVTSPSPETTRWVSLTGHAHVWQPGEAEVDVLLAGGGGDGRVPEHVAQLVRRRLLDGKRILLRIELDSPELLAIREATR